MTFQYATSRIKPVKRSPTLWQPHAYQKRATDFLLENGAAALFADPGLGKTSIVLNALTILKQEGVANRTLVIAPKRVCELVWHQESQKWSQFNHLTFAWLHSSRAPWAMDQSPKKKDEEIERNADVYLINPEGVAWLAKKFYGRQLPFDTVVVDELTKFKNAQAKRSKSLRKMTTRTPRMWGLTGTPAPNGYEDLFGQILLLDGGNALGNTFSQFRDKYFVPSGFNGYEYELAPGADRQIERRIAPLVLRMSAEDYLDLPPLVDDVRLIKLDDKARKTYDRMKKEMLLAFDDGVVTAANAAALYSKLSQMANGAVYVDEDPLASATSSRRQVVHIHDAKLDALEELIEELAGQPLLLGYEFNHDIDRLKVWYRKKYGRDLRYIGKGVPSRAVYDIERDWNEGLIDLLPCHPASTGHGLNMQIGNAKHVGWFSELWDYELYDQFIWRVRRQGNESEHVVNHILAVEDTIDVLKIEALKEKDTTQDRLLDALNTEILPRADTPAAGKAAKSTKETDMVVRKLRTKSQIEDDAGAEETEESVVAKKRIVPKGWGKPATANDDATEPEEDGDEETQRAAIENKLRGGKFKPRQAAEPEDGDDDAPPKSAFSDEIRRKVEGDDDGEESAEEVEKPKPASKSRKPALKMAKTSARGSASDTEAKVRGIVDAFEAAVRAILDS